jgi:hypothetical protein
MSDNDNDSNSDAGKEQAFPRFIMRQKNDLDAASPASISCFTPTKATRI